MYARLLINLLLLASVPFALAQPQLLSGEIAARNSQVFVAPQADNWMVQIAWMVEEGARVAVGEPVVQYETASITATLEQLEATLRRVKAESRRNNLIQDLALLEAEHRHRIAQLNLRKTRLDADIPRELLSELQHEQYQLALTQASNAYQEAEKALATQREDVVAEKQRSELEITSAENELERIQVMLSTMTQYSQRAGTAMYVDHPWTGQKIREGDSIQRGFSVLEIPSTDDLHIKAWLNEVDVAHLQEGEAVKISFDAKPKLQLVGQVARIGNQAEPKNFWGESGYIEVLIDFEHTSAHGLLPGMSVMVEVLGETQ